MIVMKFGGSSVASATAIEWVAGIVKSRLQQQPVVVVSAMGKTTDRLEGRKSRVRVKSNVPQTTVYARNGYYSR